MLGLMVSIINLLFSLFSEDMKLLLFDLNVLIMQCRMCAWCVNVEFIVFSVWMWVYVCVCMCAVMLTFCSVHNHNMSMVMIY